MNGDEFTFNGQRKNEKVLKIVKNHWFVLAWPVIQSIFFLALGIATLIYFPDQFSGIVLVVCVLIAAGIFSRIFYNYSQSIFLITSERVINVSQKGFLSKEITETDIDKIQSVSSKTSGMFGIMFKFGNLMIHTAGSGKDEEIIVKNIPNPYEVQQGIGKIR